MLRMTIKDNEWARISRFFPDSKGLRGRPRKNDIRLTLEAIFWVQRTGAPWRDLPTEFGPWETAYTSFRRWTKANVWARIMSNLRKTDIKGKCEVILVDATIVRAHQHAAGAKGGKKNMRLAVPAVASQPKFTSQCHKTDTPYASP